MLVLVPVTFRVVYITVVGYITHHFDYISRSPTGWQQGRVLVVCCGTKYRHSSTRLGNASFHSQCTPR